VSSDSQTCSYTLNGSGVCSAACSNFSSCEDQAGQALASCEGGGSSGNSGGNSGGGCQFAGVHPGDAASWAALVVGGALIALLRWRRRGDLARA
jgi:hypothetical protein